MEVLGAFLLHLWFSAFVIVFTAAASVSIMERQLLSAIVWIALGALALTLVSYA